MSKINSRRKGCAGERELAHYLTDHGFPSRRGQQFQGTPDSPDVISNIPNTHIECKRVEKLNIYKAIEQAKADAGDQTPVVIHRKNNSEWLITIRLDDYLKMVSGQQKQE